MFNTNKPIEVLEKGLKELEMQKKICDEHEGRSFSISEMHRSARDYMQHTLDLLKAKMEPEKDEYQVWVTLEKWQDENKICDIETCLVGTIKTEEEGRQLFIAAQDVSLAIKSSLEPMLKTLEI